MLEKLLQSLFIPLLFSSCCHLAGGAAEYPVAYRRDC